MEYNNFLSVSDLSPNDIDLLIEKASVFKSGNRPKHLSGKTIALIFEKPSLRTRVSFEIAIRSQGGECIYLGREEVGLGIREPVPDELFFHKII